MHRAWPVHGKSSGTISRSKKADNDSDARLTRGLAVAHSEVITSGPEPPGLWAAAGTLEPLPSSSPSPAGWGHRLSAVLCCPPASFHSQWRWFWCQGKTERWKSKPRPAWAPSDSLQLALQLRSRMGSLPEQVRLVSAPGPLHLPPPHLWYSLPGVGMAVPSLTT